MYRKGRGDRTAGNQRRQTEVSLETETVEEKSDRRQERSEKDLKSSARGKGEETEESKQLTGSCFFNTRVQPRMSGCPVDQPRKATVRLFSRCVQPKNATVRLFCRLVQPRKSSCPVD